jgi:hypothetical protein
MMLFLAACGSPTGASRATATGAPPTVEASATPGPTETATTVPPTATPSLRGKVIRIVAAVQTGANYNPLYIHATATCPSGTHLLSGGYESTDPPDATRSNTNLQNVPDSYPLDTSSWYAYTSISNPTAGVNFYAYADCLQVSFPVTTIIVSTPNQGPNTIACPNNYIPTGGGWKSNPNGVDLSKPSGNGWAILLPQQVFAVCANLASVASPPVSATFQIPSALTQLSVPIQIKCPGGQLLTGGGFGSSAPRSVLKLNKQTLSSDGSTWQESVLNIDSVHTYGATIYGVCLRIRPQ